MNRVMRIAVALPFLAFIACETDTGTGVTDTAGDTLSDAVNDPGVDDDAAETIARGLEGRGVPLLGSRRGHLDAGCSAVLRTSPHAQGVRAAALARRVLRGDAPQTLGVVRLRRHLHEVSLNAARRLGHEVPLPVVATADHLVPSLGGRR